MRRTSSTAFLSTPLCSSITPKMKVRFPSVQTKNSETLPDALAYLLGDIGATNARFAFVTEGARGGVYVAGFVNISNPYPCT